VLRQLRLTFALTMQIASAIAFCAMLAAIFWRASTISATDASSPTLGHDGVTEARAGWQMRPKSPAEILMGPRNNLAGSGHPAQR
jgi:hypothetical protein